MEKIIYVGMASCRHCKSWFNNISAEINTSCNVVLICQDCNNPIAIITTQKLYEITNEVKKLFSTIRLDNDDDETEEVEK